MQKQQKLDHEWIKLKQLQIEICHWCGVCRETHENTPCKSRIKISTKGEKLVVTKR